MFKLKKDLRGNGAIHSTDIFNLCLLVFAEFVSVFKFQGYLSFHHLNLVHKLRLYIFSAVYISLYKKNIQKNKFPLRKKASLRPNHSR